MSGRPSRNCKRRSASEMLGKSPGRKKPSKPGDAESPAPKAKKPKLDSPKKSVTKQPAKQTKVNTTMTPEEPAETPETSTRSSRRAAMKNSAPSKISTKLKLKGESASSGDSETLMQAPVTVPAMETLAWPTKVVVASNVEIEVCLEDAVVQETVVEEVLVPTTDLVATEGGMATSPSPQKPTDDKLMYSTQEETQSADSLTDVLESSEVDHMSCGLQINELHSTEESDITLSSEPDNEPKTTISGDSLTLVEDQRDRNTLPDRTEAIDDTGLITLESEEVIFGGHFDMVSSEPLEVETLEPLDPSPVVEPIAPIIVSPQKKQRLITASSIKGTEKVQDIIPATVPEVTEVSVELSQMSEEPAVAESIPQTIEDEDAPIEMVAVTKTYIVGKNNRIQELLVHPGPAKNSYSDPKKQSQAAESDDEEFEYEDEEERITLEGLEMNEAVLFCEKMEDNYPVDELVLNMFERIKPVAKLENHCSFAPESGYRCNHCVVDDGVLGITSKKEMVMHLRREHIPEYAPWQCPICQFKCIYPGSLLLHMNMHSKNKPFKCDKCEKKFSYKYKLQMHLKYHIEVASHTCPLVDCKLVFHEEESLQKHIDNRHNSEKVIYQGDNRAIIQEGGTSLGDALDLLVSGDEGDNGMCIDDKNSQLYRVQEGSIKIADMPEDGSLPQEYVSAGGDSQSNLPISVVAQSDLLGNPNSLVQIMPVSFRNDSGMPETINVVITVPHNTDGVKLLSSTGSVPTVIQTAMSSKSDFPGGHELNSTDWLTKSKMNSVDKELLEYCEVLPQPIHYNNQRAFIKCKVCAPGMEIHFASVTQFCEHLRKDHPDKDIRPYQCTQCEYKCRVRGNLDQHVKFHSKERPFVCSICGKGFIQKYKLNLHLKFHENRREWRCEECGSAFNDKQDLSRHNKNVHFNKDLGVKCPHCERVFKNEYMLSQHIHVHTGERNYKCEICTKQYSTKESLRSHMKGHQFQFGCEICAKPLGSYSAFIAHKRLHDPNQKGYQCEHCGKVLLFKATLEAHIKSVHSDVKDFMCEQCDKGFKTQAQLNNHMISHSKEKPYLCQICGYAVKRRDSLRQHMYRHADVKPYRCGRCGKEYTQKQALEIHLKSKHAGVTTFNCTMCDRGFNTNYLLKKHMQKSHGVELLSKMPKTDQVIIAQQQVEDAVDSHPPAPEDMGVLAPVAKKQTVLINAHICEHCHEVFVSQHALAVHILSEHMNQNRVNDEDPGSIPTNIEDGQVVNISETVEIPIGEEMVLVQSVEPGVLTAAIEKGAARIVTSADGTIFRHPATVTVVSSTAMTGSTSSVSLLPTKIVSALHCDRRDDMAEIMVTGDTIEEEVVEDSDMELRIVEISATSVDVQTVNMMEDCEEGTVEQVVSTSTE